MWHYNTFHAMAFYYNFAFDMAATAATQQQLLSLPQIATLWHLKAKYKLWFSVIYSYNTQVIF